MNSNGKAPRLPCHALIPVAILLLLNVMHMAEVKTFVPWIQVTHIWESDRPFLDPEEETHLYRALIAAPGLWLEDLWPEHGFSIYVSLFVFLVSLLVARTQKLVSGHPPQVWAWFALLALFMLMNGRGAIGWAGWMLCVHACIGATMGVRSGWSVTTVSQCFLGLAFTTVSSGIFIASVALIAYFVLATMRLRGWRSPWTLSTTRPFRQSLLLISASVAGYLVLDYLVAAIIKILDFYGGGLGGIVGAASHGIAAQIESVTAAHVLAGVLVVSIGIIFAFSHYGKRVDHKLLAPIVIPLFGAIFGVLVMTLSFPIIIIAIGMLVRFPAIRS